MDVRLPQQDIRPANWDSINQSLELAPRELEAVQWLCVKTPRKLIAQRMGISRATVDKDLDRAYKKAGVHDRMEMLLLCQALAKEQPAVKPPKKPGKNSKRRKK